MNLLLIAALATACGSNPSDSDAATGTASSCRADFAADKGYGYEDDLRIPTSPGGDAQPPPLPPALDEALSTCAAEAGSNCDRERILTRDAALCIARGLGLSQGIAPWKAGLTFHHGHRRIVWNVQNTLHSSADGGDGDVYTIDAATGNLLDKSGWSAIS